MGPAGVAPTNPVPCRTARRSGSAATDGEARNLLGLMWGTGVTWVAGLERSEPPGIEAGASQRLPAPDLGHP